MKKGNSDNQSGILFPAAGEINRTETDLIAMIKTTGKEKDYELIEYILNRDFKYTRLNDYRLYELYQERIYFYENRNYTEDWNAGTGVLKYVASELLVMGDLTDDTVIKDLEREILETDHADIEGQGNVWTKNLVERRLDVIRIAKGDEEAYIRHEWTYKDWMEKGGVF